MQQSSKLAEIHAFIALAETGSFTAAARRLGRDATAVSRGVQALEHRLGIRLAHRSTRAVALTEAGRAYLERVQPLLRELARADEEAAAFGLGEPRGHLRVALPGSFARQWLAPLITGFLAAHPKVTMDAHYSNAFADVIADGFDLAVRLGDLADSRLVIRKVATRRRLLCASPGYLAARSEPTAPSEIAGHDCLCFTGRAEPFRWTFQRGAEKAGAGATQTVSVAARVSSDDADILVEAALAGLGLFYTTDWHVGPLLREGRLVEVMPAWRVVDAGGVYVLTGASSGAPVKTQALSDWIAKGLAGPPWTVPRPVASIAD